MMMDDMGPFGWGFGFGWIFMLIFWTLVIVGIVTVMKWMLGKPSVNNTSTTKTAIDILEERYAKGEIEREEFEQKKSDLDHSS